MNNTTITQPTEGKPQHTPGPWIAHTSEPGYGPHNCVTDAEQHLFIADCDVSMKHRTPEEAAANARLIAASPDLLAALQNVEGILQDARILYIDSGKRPENGSEGDPGSEWAALIRSIEEIRAAIAKAIGS